MAPPSAAAVWLERHDRALKGRQFCKRRVELIHELLRVENELRSDTIMRPEERRGWQPNPHNGDTKHAAAERRRIYGELGDWLGIGAPPEDFFGGDR